MTETMPRSTPAARLLRARLDAGDPDAQHMVRDALERHGSASAAAEELGVSPATAARWARLLGRARPRGNPAFRSGTQNGQLSVTKSVTETK